MDAQGSHREILQRSLDGSNDCRIESCAKHTTRILKGLLVQTAADQTGQGLSRHLWKGRSGKDDGLSCADDSKGRVVPGLLKLLHPAREYL